MKSFDSIEGMLASIPKPRWYVRVWYKIQRVFRDLFVERPDRLRNLIERARYGYGHRDLWSFDTYITGVVSRATSDLEDRMHGHPADVTAEEWSDTLLEISSGAGVYANQMEDDPFNDTDNVVKRGRDAMKLFAENLDGMWD
jgi:hypothetical protein